MSAPAGPMPTQPGATEVAGWTNRRSAARERYAQALATNAFQQAELGRNRDVNMANQSRAQSRQRSTLGDSYAQRGIYGSGVYGRGLRNFYLDMAEQQRGLQEQYLSGMGALNLGALNAEGSLAQQLGAIDTEQTAREAELAAQIRGVM